MSLNTYFTPALLSCCQIFFTTNCQNVCHAMSATMCRYSTHKQLNPRLHPILCIILLLFLDLSWTQKLFKRNNTARKKEPNSNIYFTANKKLVIETSGENYKADFFICSEKWNWVTQGRGISIFLSFSPRLYHPCRKQFVRERKRNVETGKLGERNSEPEWPTSCWWIRV